jgi:hypothetical protein
VPETRPKPLRNRPRLVLHVGLPQSGTTFLQRSLAANAEALGDRGVHYPVASEDLMFRAALDVRGNHKAWGRRRKDVEGAWDDLVAHARAHVGTTVISHDLLAGACGRRIDAALSMLKGLDVQVVVTARDPARQLVSAWQRSVEHGHRTTFAEFEAAVREGGGALAEHFLAGQDLPAVLSRWGRWLPSENVHVVTVAGHADPRLLWSRFARAVGFDADGFGPVGPRDAGESLGIDGIDLLRRVNIALDGRLRQPAYSRLVQQRVAREVLVADGSPRPVVPPSVRDALVPLGERWAKELAAAGYVVHGDLAELVPAASSGEAGPHPDEVSTEHRLELALEVAAELLIDLSTAQEELAVEDARRRSWKKKARVLAERLSAGA